MPEPGPGEVLVRNTWTSVDAALRLRLRELGGVATLARLEALLSVYRSYRRDAP